MTRNNGLMVFWAHIDPANWLEYQQWHNCQHIPERVAIEGFNAGRRYRSAADPSLFMMFYETETAASLQSKAYLHALGNPTAWTRKALGWFRDGKRSVYTRSAETGSAHAEEAPLLVAIRYDGKDAWAAKSGGVVRRVQQFLLDDAASNVKTSEQSIHGAAPTERTALALLEISTSDLLQESQGDPGALRALAQSIGLPAALDAEVELYWLEIALRKPTS
ncbi:MAG: hypothetical protein EBS65_14385 [Betaproteobacteria bacterium]|nr:hypothetical protein [Betaproteobacteria bacterium]